MGQNVTRSKECRGPACEYWGKTCYCCDYSDRVGKTRIATHGGDYRVLVGVPCPDFKKKRGSRSVWRSNPVTLKKTRRKKK